jgi:signal peptidase I
MEDAKRAGTFVFALFSYAGFGFKITYCMAERKPAACRKQEIRGDKVGDLSFRRRKNIIRMDVIKEVIIWLIELFAVCLLAFILVFYFGKKISVVGDSMEPQLKEGETAFVNRMSYLLSGPKRGDVVVFCPNGNKNSHYYIKRVAALPGETVQIVDGTLVVTDEDGNRVSNEKMQYTDLEYAGVAEEPITLGDEEYFVIGDNYDFSEDSRNADIGNVSRQDIEGKVWGKKLSFFHFKRVR